MKRDMDLIRLSLLFQLQLSVLAPAPGGQLCALLA
jgi:hypothetical protein